MTKDFTRPVLAMPRFAKRLIALLVDSSLAVVTIWLALYLRLGEFYAITGPYLTAALLAVGLGLPVFVVFGLYRAIFRYAGWPALLAVSKACAVYGLLFSSVVTVMGIDGVPRTIGIIQPLLMLMAVGASRLVARFWLGGLYRQQLMRAALPKVLIYGAGNAGRQVAVAMAHSHELQIVGFLDDDDRLHGHVLNGLPIYNPEDLPALVDSQAIHAVLLAMPSISRRRRNEIIESIHPIKVSVRTLPTLGELAQGKVSMADLRELDIDDLLGREAVAPNTILLGKNVSGRVVLVTGAGGSIGSELCRQIARLHPATLLMVEHSEYALFQIHQELEPLFVEAESRLVPLLASVRDVERMHGIMATWRPDTVYHAAAYKHVPLVEHNPCEGVRNNVFGTLVTAQAARTNGVADFVLISTDKAVRPTNIMGASKRLAEMTLQALAAQGGVTKFAMVRFGNVLGSSGSVVPLFRRQIREGGPVTLTHPEINRYFMTIPEAAQLVIQAGAMARGGDVFVLDMGQPVRIIDLARRMVELSGLEVRDEANPDGEIEIAITGLRPGEKLYEELLIGDNPQPTSHPRIMKASEDFLPWARLETKLDALAQAIDSSDVAALRLLLEQLVVGYTPSSDIVDWVHLENEAVVARQT